MTAEYVHQSLFPLTHRCQRAIITRTRSDRQQSYKTGRDFFLKPDNNNTNLAALVPLLHTHLRKLLLLLVDPGSKSFQKPKTKIRIQKSKQLKPKNPHAAAAAASCRGGTNPRNEAPM
jgi:hypothetical protein